MFIGRTNADAEAPILCPPHARNRLIGKDPDAGKDWKQEDGVTEDKMVGWHHRFNGQEFEQTPGDSEGQGSLACCSSRGHKESDIDEVTEDPGMPNILLLVSWAGFSSFEDEHNTFEVKVWNSQSPRGVSKRTSRANKICTGGFERLSYELPWNKFVGPDVYIIWQFSPTQLLKIRQIQI